MPDNSAIERTGFREVKEEILTRIRDRTWGPGELLPGEIELSREFGCARATVNRAMRELAEEGVLERKRKAGTRVVQHPVRHARFEIPIVRHEIEATGADYRYALVNSEVVEAPDWLRARMGLGGPAKVLHVQCMHYASSSPYQYEDRWINMAVVPKVRNADFTSISPNEWLVNEVPFSRAEFSFSAGAANEVVARFLEISESEPVFMAERITWLEDQPITFARMAHPENYRLVSRL